MRISSGGRPEDDDAVTAGVDPAAMASRAPDDPPWLFVVGAPRSGTTLLWAMLNSHPEIAAPFESHFIPEFLDDRSLRDQDSSRSVDRFCGALSSNDRFEAWGLPIGEVRDEIHRIDGDPTVERMIRAVFSAWARREGKPRWADKTPRYALEIPTIAQAFDEARFIHLIRDGRDNACSYLSSTVGPDSVEATAMMWSRYVAAAQRGGRSLQSGRYHEVRYEALVADPETELRSICELAEVEFVPSMLDHTAAARRLLSSPRQSQTHPNVLRPITPALRDFHRELSPHDLAVFEGRVGPLLTSLGYPLAAQVRWTRHLHRVRHVTRARLRSAHATLSRWLGRSSVE